MFLFHPHKLFSLLVTDFINLTSASSKTYINQGEGRLSYINFHAKFKLLNKSIKDSAHMGVKAYT